MKRLQNYVVLALCLFVLMPLLSTAKETPTRTSWRIAATPKKESRFPNILGYQTLIADLHMHTVFSDGNVWPTVRVDEAWREDLDVIAISDHIEYQPHKDDLPTNHNRPYEMTVERSKALGILQPRAAEITKGTPPGHFNAIFLDDIDPVEHDDVVTSLGEANKQGAFVFWNHQAWQGEEKGRWLDVHTELYEKKFLHGMEVSNGGTYYPNAHKWCIEKGLTMMGTSDIHAPSMLREAAPDEHRTVTLILAEERTVESVKEALFAGRTIVWYKQQLIGHAKYLTAMVEASIILSEPRKISSDTYLFDLTNTAHVDLVFKRMGGNGPSSFTLPANSSTVVRAKIGEDTSELIAEYTITNLLVAPGKGLDISLSIPLE